MLRLRLLPILSSFVLMSSGAFAQRGTTIINQNWENSNDVPYGYKNRLLA